MRLVKTGEYILCAINNTLTIIRKQTNSNENLLNFSGWVSVSRPLNDQEEFMQDSDKTLFDWIKDGDVSNVVKLLKVEPKLANLSDENGMQPMHWAADRGFASAIKSLVEHGADVNAKDADGQTPLHYATSCGHVEVIKHLLSVGAKILPDNDGLTPTDLADEQLSAVFNKSHS